MYFLWTEEKSNNKKKNKTPFDLRWHVNNDTLNEFGEYESLNQVQRAIWRQR